MIEIDVLCCGLLVADFAFGLQNFPERDEKVFADTFEVLGIEPDKSAVPFPEDDTKVHIATVQGLVKRIMYPSDNGAKPGVGQYDCIVVDECHRGYLLDRELSETEVKCI